MKQYAALNDTVYFWFAANDTSGSGGDGASPAADVRLAGAAADAIPVYSPTPVLLSHANYPAGAYEIAIAATAANGFAINNTYAIFCTLAIDAQNPTGFVGSFDLKPVEANITQLLDTAWLTPGVAGTPDVNAKLLGGTAQTGNDVGADVNDILTDTGTTLDTLIKDIPTVTEFELRTILAADYVVVGDTIAGVTAVTNDVGITQAGADKVWGTAARALTDKAGFALSSAAITAIFNKDISAYSGAGYAGTYLKNLYDNQGNWITATGFATSGALATAQSDLDIITGASGVVIQDGTIIAASLGADCITNAKIADNAIAVENIKDSAISAAKIATDAITATKIAANAIGSSEFAQAAADKVRASVCVTGDPANSIGKILYELYTNRLTSARAGYLENINNANLATIADISTFTSTEIAYLNASISSRSSHTAANVWAVGTRALTDKAGFGLSTAGILAIWHQLTANIVTANTIGKLLKDDINATISSRSSHDAAAVWSAGSRALSTPADYKADISALALEATLTAMKGAGFLTGTDSLEAIRNRGDSAWTTGAGGDATAANQTTIINHLTDVKGTNFVKDTHSLKQILDLIQRTLGLTQENHYIDNTTFITGKLTAARIRIYSVAGSVGTAADVIATYNIATTYDVDGNMDTYKVTKA